MSLLPDTSDRPSGLNAADLIMLSCRRGPTSQPQNQSLYEEPKAKPVSTSQTRAAKPETVEPEALADAQARMAEILDPEETNTRAHADQARLVAELGGREKLLAAPQWNFTPADSR